MNKNNKAKARKVFLTDQEYEPLHEQAENAALSFSAYEYQQKYLFVRQSANYYADTLIW